MRIKIVVYILSVLFVFSCTKEYHSISLPYKKGKSIKQSYRRVSRLPKIGEHISMGKNAIFFLPTEGSYIECASVACDGIMYYIGIEQDKAKYVFCMDEKAEIGGMKIGDVVGVELIAVSEVVKSGDIHYLRTPICDNWYTLVNGSSNKIFMFVRK